MGKRRVSRPGPARMTALGATSGLQGPHRRWRIGAERSNLRLVVPLPVAKLPRSEMAQESATEIEPSTRRRLQLEKTANVVDNPTASCVMSLPNRLALTRGTRPTKEGA
jgi:hypothetical protein